jgi:hypothetical protein
VEVRRRDDVFAVRVVVAGSKALPLSAPVVVKWGLYREVLDEMVPPERLPPRSRLLDDALVCTELSAGVRQFDFTVDADHAPCALAMTVFVGNQALGPVSHGVGPLRSAIGYLPGRALPLGLSAQVPRPASLRHPSPCAATLRSLRSRSCSASALERVSHARSLQPYQPRSCATHAARNVRRLREKNCTVLTGRNREDGGSWDVVHFVLTASVRVLPCGWTQRGLLNFAVASAHATEVSLVLEADGEQLLELALDPVLHRTGDVWHVALPADQLFEGDLHGLSYRLRCNVTTRMLVVPSLATRVVLFHSCIAASDGELTATAGSSGAHEGQPFPAVVARGRPVRRRC